MEKRRCRSGVEVQVEVRNQVLREVRDQGRHHWEVRFARRLEGGEGVIQTCLREGYAWQRGQLEQ